MNCEPNVAFCLCWTGLNEKRESSGIETCLLKYIMQLHREVKHLTLYSDTYGGQNQAKNIPALFLYFIQKKA